MSDNYSALGSKETVKMNLCCLDFFCWKKVYFVFIHFINIFCKMYFDIFSAEGC